MKGYVTVYLTPEQLRAVVNVIGPTVSAGNTGPIAEAEYVLDSALLEYEQNEEAVSS